MELALTLTIVTWNVFGEPVDFDARSDAAIAELGRSGAEVIALQEVSSGFLRKLSAASWVRDGGYQGIVAQDQAVAPGGLYLLSKYPIDSVRFEKLTSALGRGVLLARVKTPRGHVTFAVVHLDSYQHQGPNRKKQLLEINALLGGADAVILGDFNYGDGAPEGAGLPSTFVDAVRSVSARKPRFTWNNEKNPLAKKNAFTDEPSRRLDRVMLRSTAWRHKAVRLVGDKPFAPNRFASDHFGVRAQLKARAPK